MAQIDAVRGLIPRFEAKILRVLDRVWGSRAGDDQVDISAGKEQDADAQDAELTEVAEAV